MCLEAIQLTFLSNFQHLAMFYESLSLCRTICEFKGLGQRCVTSWTSQYSTGSPVVLLVQIQFGFDLYITLSIEPYRIRIL
jgi:hypothetical protein